MSESRRSRGLALVILAVATAVLSGCVSIPTSSSPKPIGTLPSRGPSAAVPMPRSGMTPEALVRDFLKATANPGSNHQAARQYLTESAASAWDDRGDALIVDQISVLTDARSDDSYAVRVIADNTGTLSSDGHLTPATGRVESSLRLTSVDGQWRIDGALPRGVMIDRTQFTSSYRTHNVYFPSPSGERLVADPRWVYATGGSVADQVIDLVVGGPSAELAPAVDPVLPGSDSVRASVETNSAGGRTVTFAGLGNVDARGRALFAAQVIWTLSGADVPGPYVIQADGAPLDDRYADGWTTADVSSLDPAGPSRSSTGLLVVRSGSLDRVTDTALAPVSGTLGTSGAVLSAAVSDNGQRVAAVTRTATGEELVLGDLGGPVTSVASGQVITRPSFGAGNDTVWAVVDGRVERFRRDATGTITNAGSVSSNAIAAVAPGAISELQVSRDGARVAAIVGGVPVLGVVAVASDGSLSLTGLRVAAFNIGSQAASLDWVSGDTVVIARRTTDSPIVQVTVDGTPAVGLLSGNLTPPVTAVVGDRTTLYAADARGILRLGSTNGDPDQYWNEVGPTVGTGAIPVLAQ
ncbi:LpqB family beta-propeller domain-containing protein [uncultured Williamsia sp.]|uniref:LpqB family beta-propeller domain-containing protein n=1 Tax=uncultured Williamsia sp. TaxID=259311 RepID=UPI00260D6FFD|nr:LpqB family beta-propeller domain-containing protein [uncultured Williamsia sp.]